MNKFLFIKKVIDSCHTFEQKTIMSNWINDLYIKQIISKSEMLDLLHYICPQDLQAV